MENSCSGEFDGNFLKKDCIDCGGCSTKIETSSEPLFPQNLDPKSEFLSILKTTNKKIIISLSPQSRSSLAVHYNISNELFVEKLITMLSQWNIEHLFDTSFASQIALIESLTQFLDRKKNSLHLPMLTSNCPGFVTYAETSHDYLLPYISSVKSPQQVMGALIKNYFSKQILVEPSSIYHITIMPCLDKRNESMRKKFYDEQIKTKEVDLVLTTEEFMEIIIEQQIDFMSLDRGIIKPLFNNYDESTQKFFGTPGGSSDGFLEFIFKQTAMKLYNVEIDKIEYIKRENNDNFRDVVLNINGETVLRFGAVYGFRNIQQIAKIIKQSTCDYDFLEVMACPRGCTNGGGQLKPPRDGISRSELIEKVNILHNSQEERLNEQVFVILKKWFLDVDNDDNEDNDDGNNNNNNENKEEWEKEEKEKKKENRIKQLYTLYRPGEESKESQNNNNVKKGCKCTSTDVQW